MVGDPTQIGFLGLNAIQVLAHIFASLSVRRTNRAYTICALILSVFGLAFSIIFIPLYVAIYWLTSDGYAADCSKFGCENYALATEVVFSSFFILLAYFVSRNMIFI